MLAAAFLRQSCLLKPRLGTVPKRDPHLRRSDALICIIATLMCAGELLAFEDGVLVSKLLDDGIAEHHLALLLVKS